MLATSSDQKEKDILQSIKAIEQRSMPLIAQVRSLRDAGDRLHAEEDLLKQARPAFIDWLASINAFIDLQEAKNREAAEEAVATARGFAMLMVVSTIVALLLGAAIALLLTRSVVLPLRQALGLAERISAGDLSSRDVAAGADESGQLLRAMQQMQARLQAVISAQREMAARHDAGAISYRTDAERFPGDYGHMVQDTNALVDAHVRTQLRMTESWGATRLVILRKTSSSIPARRLPSPPRCRRPSRTCTRSMCRSRNSPRPLVRATSAAAARLTDSSMHLRAWWTTSTP